MYKSMLLIVVALALIAIASAQVFFSYPQSYAPVYTYPTYGYNYPLSYYSPYTFLRR